MVEVFGVEMYESEYEAVCAVALAKWSEMDDFDREDYDGYEDFEDMYLHSYVWSEV